MTGDKTRASALTPLEFARFLWTQLTSMRTALSLLFLGALAAIPGSLIPQRPVSPAQVDQFLTDNPRLGGVYEALGLFNVYTSPWFSAIYLLLLISLVGCIIPRCFVYARALRAEPVAVPSRLDRMPVSASAPRSGSVASALDRGEAWLKQHRYRVRRERGALSAERGYLREFGNLVFHISLVFLLIGITWTVTFGYRGTSNVLVGQGFSNTLTQYDEISSGPAFTDADLAPFSVAVEDFEAQFEQGEVNTGQPREFALLTRVVDEPGAQPREYVIRLNEPLEVRNTQIHLLGHGYAPQMTVRDGDGDIAWQGPSMFMPQDGNLTSTGVINAVDARPERLGFEGFFLPTGTVDEMGPRSLFPDALKPQVFLTAYHGPPKHETGVPTNVHTLDKNGLEQFSRPDGSPLSFKMDVGETVELPDGRGTITFDGYQRWVRLQVSHQPGMGFTLASVIVAVLGLCLSLFVRPRRLWVRVDDDRLDVAGLDRADARTGLADEVEQLAESVLGEETRHD